MTEPKHSGDVVAVSKKDLATERTGACTHLLFENSARLKKHPYVLPVILLLWPLSLSVAYNTLSLQLPKEEDDFYVDCDVISIVEGFGRLGDLPCNIISAAPNITIRKLIKTTLSKASFEAIVALESIMRG